MKNALKKYLFGWIVVSYLITTIGMPVYLHYCGGELERANFMIKGSGCCGDENESDDAGSDCCKDESLYIQNHHSFTIKSVSFHFPQVCTPLFFFTFASVLPFNTAQNLSAEASFKEPPPKLLNSAIIATSILRI